MCRTLNSSSHTRELRHALGQFPTGVAIVTTTDEAGKPVGMTINSFSSVSLVPALVSWCIDRRAASYSAFARCERFALSVLSQGQQALATRFAQRGADKFADIDVIPAHPVFLPGSAAWFDCEVHNRFLLGDHLMLIGRVTGTEQFETDPLVFARGKFQQSNTDTVRPLAAAQ